MLFRSPQRRRELLARAADFRAVLQRAGIDIGGAEAQIVPIVAGAPEAAVALSDRLAAEGFFVPAIRPPSVPEGRSLVRASLSWHHEPRDVERLVAALRC